MSISDRLDEITARANAATDGSWAAWQDQDGADHMQGLLMVGNAAAVIPEGESWIEGVDVNPIAHTYCEEDRQFIAHAKDDVPELVEAVRRRDAALRAVLDLCDNSPLRYRPGLGVGSFTVLGTSVVRDAIINALEESQEKE